MEREKELASLKLRLGTTGVQKSENFEIRSRSPTRENPDDDSLISKARTRWADLGKIIYFCSINFEGFKTKSHALINELFMKIIF